MSDAPRWKAKYLASLEQLEQLQQHCDNRLDLLRRCLSRSAMAAEGVDAALDECLAELREALRQEDESHLQQLLPRLEKSVLESDRRRQSRRQQSVEALAQLLQPLLELARGSALRRPLKAFARQLQARGERPQELPALLAELGHWQRQVLAQARDPARPGLWRRLFAGSAPATAQASDPEPEPPEPAAGAGSFPLPISGAPGYSEADQHIAASLLGLLDKLHLSVASAEPSEQLRERLHSGLNWYELVPLLDDLGRLLLTDSEHSRGESGAYLEQLDRRLSTLVESLEQPPQGGSETQQPAMASNPAQNARLGSTYQSTDLDRLKRSIDSRLEELARSLQAGQQEREHREHDLLGRLQALALRVGEIEQEAQQYRASLDQQRQQALLDPLTGLANRAAWHERSLLEHCRWERHGGELQLAVVAIDRLEQIRADFGQPAADRVLKLIARTLRKRTRKSDVLARIDSAEFALLLPGTAPQGGLQLLENLRQAVAACPFHFKGQPLPVTLSGGLSHFASGDSLDSVFARAMQALDQARRDGHDRIRSAGVSPGAAADSVP